MNFFSNIYMLLKKFILFILIFFLIFNTCSRSKKDLVGKWECESLDSDTGIGYSYTMTFTEDNRWVPNDSEFFTVDYQIKNGKIVYISQLGITVHSDFRIFNNELTISTLGIQSECTKQLPQRRKNRI